MAPKKPTAGTTPNPDEFNEIVDSTKSTRKTKGAEAAKRNATTVKKAAKALSVDAVVSEISSLGLDVNRTLATVSEKILGKVTELTQLQEAVELEKAELERLHGVDVVALEIDVLVAEYEAKKTALQNEMSDQQEQWAKEKAKVEMQAREFAAEIIKNRNREIADYDYTKNMERKRSQDTFDEQLRASAKKGTENQEALEKVWRTREEAIASKEERFVALENEVATFPEVLKKEVSKAEAIVGNTMKREHDHATKLFAMQAESDKRALVQEVASQKATIALLEGQLATLRSELDSKSGQVMEIASQAVQSASGRLALESLKDVQRESGASTSKK